MYDVWFLVLCTCHLLPASTSAGCVLLRHVAADTEKAAYSSWFLLGPGWAGRRASWGPPGLPPTELYRPWGLMWFHQGPGPAYSHKQTHTRACMVCTHAQRKCKCWIACQASLVGRRGKKWLNYDLFTAIISPIKYMFVCKCGCIHHVLLLEQRLADGGGGFCVD